MNYTKNYKKGGGKKTQRRRSSNQTQQSTKTKQKKIKFSDVRKQVCDWFEQQTGQKCSTIASTALLSIVGGLTYNRYVNQKSSKQSITKNQSITNLISPKELFKKVFVGVEKKDQGTTVYGARYYQTLAFYDFMNNNNNQVKEYQYGNDVKFKILKFNSEPFKENYDRFCVLQNEQNEEHILSDNEHLLRCFTGWKNRLIAPNI